MGVHENIESRVKPICSRCHPKQFITDAASPQLGFAEPVSGAEDVVFQGRYQRFNTSGFPSERIRSVKNDVKHRGSVWLRVLVSIHWEFSNDVYGCGFSGRRNSGNPPKNMDGWLPHPAGGAAPRVAAPPPYHPPKAHSCKTAP